MKNRAQNKPFGDIGDRLLAVRQYLQLEQAAFCREVGITQSSYSNWETGAYRCSLDGALRIRDRYGISLDFIYRGNLDALPHKVANALSSNPLVRNSAKSIEIEH